MRIVDDVSLRRELSTRIASSDRDEVWASFTGHHQLPGGDRVLVESREGPSLAHEVLFRRWNSNYAAPIAAGSWTFTIESGVLTKARYWPRSDSEIWVDFTILPADIVQMSVRIYGGWPLWRRQVPLRPAELLSLPLDSIMSRVSKVLPLGLFTVYTDDYGPIRDLDASIRRYLPLHYREDGAVDFDGRAVFIANGLPQEGRSGLNCSGFAKWIVDGVLAGFGKPATRIDELKKAPIGRGHSFSDALEASHEPWFGLDWTRNLAIAGAMASDPSGRVPHLTEYEIGVAPFALLDRDLFAGPSRDTSLDPWPWPGFYTDSGFPLEGLAALMYIFSVQDSSSFYLVSMNNTPKGEQQRRHSHVAVLVPWFTERGAFRISVFESGTASDFASFIRRHQGWNAYLTRVPVPPRFEPSYGHDMLVPGSGLWRGGINR